MENFKWIKHCVVEVKFHIKNWDRYIAKKNNGEYFWKSAECYFKETRSKTGFWDSRFTSMAEKKV